jgi:hypothetical protein
MRTERQPEGRADGLANMTQLISAFREYGNTSNNSTLRGLTYESDINYMELSPSCISSRFASNQEIPAFHYSRKFITVFTTARYLSLSERNISVHSVPFDFFKIFLILSSHVSCLSLNYTNNALWM